MLGTQRGCALIVDGVAGRADAGMAGKPIAAARKDIHAVDLNARVESQIGDRAGRRDVGEQEMVVVMHDQCAFGGEVRTAVAIDGRGEAQDRTTNQALHVRIELCHGQLSFTDCLTATYGLIFATQLSKIATWRAKMQHEIDWDDLRMLISVARAGSLAGAAGALGSHRSTVLRRIERLEARLGLRLFDRTPQGLVLTAAGERVSPNAELMSDAVDEILRSVEADHGRPAGHIRLATTFNLAFGLLPCLIDRFRLAYPEIMVEVIGTLDGYSTIHPDQFDLALRTLDRDPAGHEQMVGRRLGKLQLAVYGTKSYFADRPIPKSPKRLRQHELLLGCSGLADLAAFRWLEQHVKDNTVVYRASSMLLLLAAVREGLGLACLPCYLCERDITLVRTFDVPAEHCAELWVLRHAHSRDNARIRLFADFLATELRKHILPE